MGRPPSAFADGRRLSTLARMQAATSSAEDLLKASCATLRATPSSTIDSWRRRGTKAAFFAALQQHASNLTGIANNNLVPPNEYVPPALQIATPPLRWLVIGDSIAREAAFSLQALVPSANVTYVAIALPTNLMSNGTRSWQAAVVGFLQKANSLDALMHCGYDALFLGGYGPWALRRMERHGLDPSMEKSPLIYHENRMVMELEIMRCIAKRIHMPLVFIGNIPIDHATILLHPPKADWYKFYEMELGAQLAHSEGRAYDRVVPAHERSKRIAVHRMVLTDLVDTCPHVRCDGMHYASDYTSFNCHGSMAVWHQFLRGFLTSTPGLLESSTCRGRDENAFAVCRDVVATS